jgi:hypothetical protein
MTMMNGNVAQWHKRKAMFKKRTTRRFSRRECGRRLIETVSLDYKDQGLVESCLLIILQSLVTWPGGVSVLHFDSLCFLLGSVMWLQ